LIYFKTYARENGCPESVFDKHSDAAIWNWIIDFQRVTVWERWSEKSETWIFNHISNGYDSSVTSPVPRNKIQESAWKGSTWKGTESSLTGNIVKPPIAKIEII